jgi:malonate decarboxylase delta subunit
METLDFEFTGGSPVPADAPPVLAGVVGSGNLEVLLEAEPGVAACRVQVVTASAGFEAIWRAVLFDFFERHRPAGLRVSINDVGATPAIVSLRLDQAMEAMRDGMKDGMTGAPK